MNIEDIFQRLKDIYTLPKEDDKWFIVILAYIILFIGIIVASIIIEKIDENLLDEYKRLRHRDHREDI